MNTVLHFTITGRFHCDGLATLHPGLRHVRIGGGLQPGEVGCESCPRFHKCGMSHTSTVSTQITDPAAIIAAAKEMGLPVPELKTVKLYGGQAHTGMVVKLPGWTYPIVIDTQAGTIKYDNYGGSWGKQAELDKFTQMYARTSSRAVVSWAR